MQYNGYLIHPRQGEFIMGLSGSSLLIGLDKARAISEERRSNPMYELFYTELDSTHKKLKEILHQTRLAEINWHAEVEKASGLITRARTTYYKYRELVVEQLPGASLVERETSSVTPSEVEVAIEKCINLIEKHIDAFAVFGTCITGAPRYLK